MRKIVLSCLCFLIMMQSCVVFAGMGRFPNGQDNSALTQDIDDVAGKEIQDVTDPFREGSYDLSEGLEGIYKDEEFKDTGTAWDRSTRYVKGVLNYILGIIGLVALIYLILQGFRALTAGSNEEQMSKAMKGIRYAILAIVGVGIAWFVLSLIFWLIQLVTNE